MKKGVRRLVQRKERTLDVRFKTAEELLKCYWGYMAEGGLVVTCFPSLKLRQCVSVVIRIAGEIRCTLRGEVLREGLSKQIIKFLPGEPHEQLLLDSLAADEKELVEHQLTHRVA